MQQAEPPHANRADTPTRDGRTADKASTPLAHCSGTGPRAHRTPTSDERTSAVAPTPLAHRSGTYRRARTTPTPGARLTGGPR